MRSKSSNRGHLRFCLLTPSSKACSRRRPTHKNGAILPAGGGTDPPFGSCLRRLSGTEEVGEGRHVDFVVYAGVRSGGLSECGSRDDGARGAAAPAPVTIETWRDLSSGRPRAARILLAARFGFAKTSYSHVFRTGCSAKT